MTEQTQTVEAEVVPTQAVAVRPEQPVVNPLDLEPGVFKSGLDRRKENRKALIDWVREALVEGTDFGRIPTKRGPSKPSLWKPGAEKICGMLGVTPTFPTLKQYEDAALAGREIKSIILRCEIVNSAGDPIAHGIGCRNLEQDYGDMNKAMKMAEKSAHIDATLRMAGLSEIFTQDIEDMPKAGPGAPGASGPPSSPTKAPPAPPTPKSAPKPAHIPPSAKMLKEKFIKNLDTANLRQKATQFMIDLKWLLPTEALEHLEDRYLPNTKDQYVAFLAKLMTYATSGKAELPYPPNYPADAQKPWDKGTKPADVPQGTSKEPASDDAADQPWYNVIVPIPRKGQKREAYLKHPDTIGSLFEARHGTDDESDTMRKRLWGLRKGGEECDWKPQPREVNGKVYYPSEADKKFYQALKQFADWFDEQHEGEEL